MIKFGNNNIGKIYFGSNQIGKAYFGSNLVYDAGSSPTPPVPTPYTPVEYIETDGTAYINTGIIGKVPISVEAKMTPATSANGNYYLLGARKDSGNTRLMPIALTPTKYLGFSYYNGLFANVLNVANSVDNRTPMLIQSRIRKGSQIISVKQEGDSQFSSTSKQIDYEVNTGMNIFLFAYNYIGSPIVSPAGTRAKYVKIYSDFDFGTLVFDGEACYYNGEYGLWDSVTDSFFGNAAGSGAFSGPSI